MLKLALPAVLAPLLLACSQIQTNPETASLASRLVIEEYPATSDNTLNVETHSGDQAFEQDPNCLVDGLVLASYPIPNFNSLWDRVRLGFSLPDQQHRRIDDHRAWYARHPDYMARVTQRANRYLFGIVEKIEARGLPMEFALLPIVESAFDPFGYSHARASGMWQFIPSTGRLYGLKQNYWYDGRRDIEASTDAALDYLSDLHKRLDGDWLLALASYNTGEGNVKKAIRRNKRAGKPTNFWSLRLPRETQAYVPQLLALKEIVLNPEKFQIALTPISNKPFYQAVPVDSQIDLAKAAELAEISIDDLYLLNPGFNKWATDPKGPHRLLLPVESADVFAKNLESYPIENRVTWESYRVKKGDSLLAIAKRYKTDVDTIKDINNLRSNLIGINQQLLIPVATKNSDHYAYSQTERRQRTQNNSKGANNAQKVNYVVKNGDSFWKIAQQFNVSVSRLTKWNAMAPRDTLKPGQTLVVWAEPEKARKVSLAKANLPSSNNPLIRKVNYRVRKGDSLARIASKFNLRVNDILSWNTLNQQKYIHPGQRLTLFVDITSTN